MTALPINPLWLLTVVGLLVVTWVGRALPFWFSRFDQLPEPFRRFLGLVPAAAMGALIFPDAFVGTRILAATASIVTAAVLALSGRSLITVVLAAIAVAWIALTVV